MSNTGGKDKYTFNHSNDTKTTVPKATKSCLTCSILLKSQRGGKISNKCQLFILNSAKYYKHLQNSLPSRRCIFSSSNDHVFLHLTVHPLRQRLHEQQQHQRGIPDLKLQRLHQVPQGGEPGVRRQQQWGPGQEVRAVATFFATFRIRCLFC